MSQKHPIIAVTGASGAGTTVVKRAFETIFRRESLTAAFISGECFRVSLKPSSKFNAVNARKKPGTSLKSNSNAWQING